VYPVLLRRKHTDFKLYYLISFFAGLTIIVFISSQYLDDIVNQVKTEQQDYLTFKSDGMFSSVCLIVFACMCHNDVLEVYHEMKYKNSARFKSVKIIFNFLIFP
jgi:amino acid permease